MEPLSSTVNPELNVEGRKKLIRHREVRDYDLQKARAGGQPGFQRGAVCGQRVRREGGAPEKGEIQKGRVSHTQRFEFHPKGNQMQLKAFTREHGRITFAFWKDFPASF